MFIEHLDKALVLESLIPVLEEFEEKIVPSEVKLLPHNRYAEIYAWMYAYEKRLKYRIEEILKNRLGYDHEKTLFGPGGAVSEALSNGFAHGHKKNAELPLYMWVAVSMRGIGLTIQDAGPGFAFEKIFSDYKKGNAFFHIAGNGFSSIASSTALKASYSEDGTRFALLYLFD